MGGAGPVLKPRLIEVRELTGLGRNGNGGRLAGHGRLEFCVTALRLGIFTVVLCSVRERLASGKCVRTYRQALQLLEHHLLTLWRRDETPHRRRHAPPT